MSPGPWSDWKASKTRAAGNAAPKEIFRYHCMHCIKEGSVKNKISTSTEFTITIMIRKTSTPTQPL